VAAEKLYRKGSHTAERAAGEIRGAIRSRELRPGEHVRQEYWASRIGVSNASTREALKVLVGEQLLTYEAHRGYFVSDLDQHEMEQIYLIRQVLEAEVLRSIEWPTPPDIDEIRELANQVVECLRRHDHHEGMDAIRTLSFTLFDRSPYELLVRETKRYWELAALYRQLSIRANLPAEGEAMRRYYDEMLVCLDSGDREGLILLNSRQRLRVLQQVLRM
jgi:DNA-binding GntR family transcriptional regulator